MLAIYKEDHSAKTFERPEFQKFLAFLKKNRAVVDLLLFTKWDRFSRNAGDAYGMINQLKKLAVEPQAIEQPLDLNIPENKLMLAIYLATPEVENDRRAMNVTVGMRRARKEGRYLGLAPKGYKNCRDEQNKPILKPDPKLAPVVKRIFETVAKGVQEIDGLRQAVNKEGMTFTKNQFYYLLRNPVYCGRVYISGYREEGAQTIKGMHEPIVSELLFDTVQDVLEGRKRITKVRSTKDENLPMRGFIICKTCGRPLTGSGSKGNGGNYFYYHCQSAAKCKERFRADDAHAQFIGQLRQIEILEPVLNLYYEIMTDLFKNNGMDRSKEVAQIKEQISKLNLRIKNAQALMLDGELDAAEYKEIKTNLSAETAALERKRMQVLSAEEDGQEYLDKGIPMLINITKHWQAADLEGKQHIVGSIFPERLIFENNTYRTATENPLLTLIANRDAGFSGKKKGQTSKNSDLSHPVTRIGFEPMTTSLEG